MTDDSMIVNLTNALAASRKKKRQPPDINTTKPLIRIKTGELDKTCEEVEELLGKLDIFSHSSRLVEIVPTIIKVSWSGDKEAGLRLYEFEAATLWARICQVARFEKWSKTDNDWTMCDPPFRLAEIIVKKVKWNGIRPLNGFITSPIMRADGSILDSWGYDPATELFYMPVCDYPNIVENPGKEEALEALQSFEELLRGYKFKSNVDKSIAISAILTAIMRRNLPSAPLHAFSSPVAGSGKSKLAHLASVIAYGHRAGVTSTEKHRDGSAELGKKLAASMLAGDDIVIIDNVEHELEGEFLCQCLTETVLKPRILGVSKNMTVINYTFFEATGNNLRLVGDLVRRSLLCFIDPQVERPELNQFDFDPIQIARRNRAELVMKGLTMLRACRLSEFKLENSYGSFEEWSETVRATIVWLGLEDPIKSVERIREEDSVLRNLRNMAGIWKKVFGLNAGKKVSQIVEEATKRYAADERGAGSSLINQDLYDIIFNIAPTNNVDGINPTKLGKWFRANADRYIMADGILCRFVKLEETTNGTVWVLKE